MWSNAGNIQRIIKDELLVNRQHEWMKIYMSRNEKKKKTLTNFFYWHECWNNKKCFNNNNAWPLAPTKWALKL